MLRSVQNQWQISVSLNIDTRGEINPKFDALAENLRYFHPLHSKMLTFDLESDWSNCLFLSAVFLSTAATHVLAASDATISRHYTSAPNGRSQVPGNAAGVKQLPQHQHSLAI